MPNCSECAKGENKYPADVMVKGKRWGSVRGTERWMPFTANLCDEHVGMMLEDGEEFEVVRVYNPDSDNAVTKAAQPKRWNPRQDLTEETNEEFFARMRAKAEEGAK